MRLDKFDKILDEAETREWVKIPQRGDTKFREASGWLADLLDEQEKISGFQYNASFQDWICAREGWTAESVCMDALGTAVYNAQCHRSTRKVLSEGFGYLTTEMIQRAIQLGKKIIIRTDGILGGEGNVEGRPIIQSNGEGFVLAPRSHKKGWGINSLTLAKIEEIA